MNALSRDELLAELKALPSIEPTLPGAEDLGAMNARQRRVEILYLLAGRNDADNGAHGLYTGLHLEPPF